MRKGTILICQSSIYDKEGKKIFNKGLEYKINYIDNEYVETMICLSNDDKNFNFITLNQATKNFKIK